MSKVDTVYNTFRKDPMNIRNQNTKENRKRAKIWINLNKVDANDRFQQKWEQHETWYNMFFLMDSTVHWILIQPSSEVYASRCHEVSSNLTRSTGREHWALMEFWNHMWPSDGFRNVSCFLAALFPNKCFFLLFRKKKMNRPFLPWQVCLEVPSWESLVLRHSQQVHLLSIRIDPSRADNRSLWQNTNVSALLWHVRDCPLQKFLPKISPIEVFRAPQASTTPCSSLQNWTFWATCSLPLGPWPPKYPYGRGQALHTQTQVPQQQIGWRPISISCAKTRKSSLPKRFKDHHNQFLFGQGSQTFPKDIMVGYQLTTKCRHILGVRQHPKLSATQMFLKSALWYQQLVFPLIRPKTVGSSKMQKKGRERRHLIWKPLCLTTSDGLQSNSELNLHQLDESWWYSLKISQLLPVFQPSQRVHAKLSYSMALRSTGKGQCNNWSEFLVLQEKQAWLFFSKLGSPANKRPKWFHFFFENTILSGFFGDIHPHLHFT